MTVPHWQILAAALVDAVIGDPEAWSHPVRWIGALADRLERWTRFAFRGNAGAAGVMATLTVYIVAVASAWFFSAVLGAVNQPLGFLAGTALIYYSLAARDLLDHVFAVYRPLADNDLAAARKAAGRIVGRDTDRLDASGIAKAATESVAESLADGVVGPLFWAAILGPAGAFLYRAVNTLDSMFGHRDERYREFGALAARVDDAAGYLPARLSALLLCVAGFAGGRMERAWRVWRRDHNRHASPNAGHPESAMAGLLGVELGGPVSYGGVPHGRPVLGRPGRAPAPADILSALGYSGVAYAIALALLSIFAHAIVRV